MSGSWEVVRYNINLLGAGHNLPWVADIRCYDTEDLGSSETGVIHFYPDGVAIPASSWLGGTVNGVPIVNYPISMFDAVVTTLRSEPYASLTTGSYLSGDAYVNGEFSLSTGLGTTGSMDPTP